LAYKAKCEEIEKLMDMELIADGLTSDLPTFMRQAWNIVEPEAPTFSGSWGKSSISVRELSLGGGMGVKEDNLRVGTEANLEISAGVRRIRGQVLLRRARVNEVGFEIVNMDLEIRYRLRRLIMEALEQNRDARVAEWDGVRK
jgi:hypothetical protein